jgi:hypothetical protein
MRLMLCLTRAFPSRTKESSRDFDSKVILKEVS